MRLRSVSIKQEEAKRMVSGSVAVQPPALVAHHNTRSRKEPSPADTSLQTDATKNEEHTPRAAEEATPPPEDIVEGTRQMIKCVHCSKNFKTLEAYHIHLKTIHKISDYFNGAKPIINDPNNYCWLCNKVYAQKSRYRSHLRSTHQMKLEPICQRHHQRNTDMIPDIDDANNYCCVCEATFDRKGAYRQHLRTVHKMKLSALRTTKKSIPDSAVQPKLNDPDFYCDVCQRTLANQTSYRRHLESLHNVALTKKYSVSRPTLGVDPEVDDPNNHCQSCDITFESKSRYRNHLKTRHKMNLTSKHLRGVPTPGVVPDMNDPDFFCCSCNFKYSSKDAYNMHLISVHQMRPTQTKSRRLRIVTGEAPDADSPDNHCRACNKTYISKGRYRIHLKYVHLMILPSMTKKYNPLPNVKPRINDPDNHCRSCKASFPERRYYRTHLRRVHKMALTPLH